MPFLLTAKQGGAMFGTTHPILDSQLKNVKSGNDLLILSSDKVDPYDMWVLYDHGIIGGDTLSR
jgi:hypothetical protein